MKGESKGSGGSSNQKKGGGGGAFAGGLVGSLLGSILGSVKQLFGPIQAMSSLLVAALFPILKPFLILFLKVGFMLFKLIRKMLGGERGGASSLSGRAGLSEEQVAEIRKTGERLGLSNKEIDKNISSANELEKKKNKVIGIIGVVLGAIVGVVAAIAAGFVGIPVLIIAAIIGALLGLVAIIFGREVAADIITWMKEAFIYLKEAVMSLPDNIKKLWSKFITKIKEVWASAILTLKEAFSDIGSLPGKIWGLIKGLFVGTINVASTVWGWFKGLFSFGGGSTGKVDDAIITPNGDVIRTNPNDYLIATKNPSALGGGSGSSNVNVTINGGLITEEVARDIGKVLMREINLGGGF